MAALKALVIRGSRNVFTLRPLDGFLPDVLECRIKGKILKQSGRFYNPLAPGDIVYAEDHGGGRGLILDAVERRNFFVRFNQKGPQILGSNLDMVLCVTSLSSPPFRPRFIDRVLVQSEAAGIPALVLCNKCDLVSTEPVEDRLADYERIGYPVVRVSAKTGEGMEQLRRRLEGKTAILLGQSGVGKSSVINALCPRLGLRTGALNEKYDRGNHTTTLSALYDLEFSGGPGMPQTFLIDTPGLRHMVLWGIAPEDLILYMKEFAPLDGRCLYGASCSHSGESGCAVAAALESRAIHKDRGESYVRIREELPGRYDE
ncbi:MAG: ribosome small subunit-dependent GTPase A [Treponema sp.]|jgi:ribosome biogenesis GTPase|nr:ribosome small subunit-dependent GTPase A [Treponema sp.]